MTTSPVIGANETEYFSESEDDYIVERIVGRKVEEDRVKYHVKWQRFPDENNSWEFPENLDCSDLVAQFEADFQQSQAQIAKVKEGGLDPVAKLKKQKRVTRGKQPIARSMRGEIKEEGKEDKKGFERGLKPHRIVGSCLHEGRALFLVEWKGLLEKDLVLAEEANKRCPKLVIKFHEKRLVWSQGHVEEKYQEEEGEGAEQEAGGEQEKMDEA